MFAVAASAIILLEKRQKRPKTIMNRSELQNLQEMHNTPSLSIITPTHRTSPDNLQDPIRMKNLVTEVTNRLHDEFSNREAAPLLERLNTLVGEIDWHHKQDGLALFVSGDFAGSFDLPFPVTERVLVGDSFSTRDLMSAMNRSPRYYVLMLSEHRTHLFEAVREHLKEVRTGEFPIEHEGQDGAKAMPGGHGAYDPGYRDEHDRHFLHRIDAELSKVLSHSPLPVVVTGVTRVLSLWNELSSHQSSLAGTLDGSYENTGAHELGQLVWPIMQEFVTKRRVRMMDEVGEAIGAGKLAAGLENVWQMANDGRGETLLVEEDFRPTAQSFPNDSLVPTGEIVDEADIVDDLIETVLSKNGHVVFVDNGALKAQNHIALTLHP